MFNHNHKPSVMFTAPAGEVGHGPYCVFIESSDSDHRMIEAWGFDTSDAAFAHIDKLRTKHQKKFEAVLTLLDGDDQAMPAEIANTIRESTFPDMRVYRLEAVDRVDIKTLPSLNFDKPA